MVKRILVFLGVVLLLLAAAFSYLLWRQDSESKKNALISRVKNFSYSLALEDEYLRIGKEYGPWEKYRLEGGKIYLDENGNPIRGKTIQNQSIEDHVKFVQMSTKSLQPIVWNAWKADDDIYLVGALWVQLDSVGKPNTVDGLFVEVTPIDNQESFRLISNDTDGSGTFKDYLARKYSARIQSIKHEYLTLWSK